MSFKHSNLSPLQLMLLCSLVGCQRKKISKAGRAPVTGPSLQNEIETAHLNFNCSLIQTNISPVLSSLFSRGLSLSLSPLRNLAVMPAEERRLEAEEGSLSKNTWQQKKEDIEAG